MAKLGYDKALYILAFDHRGSFQKKFFGITGEANPEEAERISDAKAVIFEGFQQAIDDGAPKESCGILVDEQFGADIVRRAKKEGSIFAMPPRSPARTSTSSSTGTSSRRTSRSSIRR